MTYQQTLDYLFSRLPMYQRDGVVAYKADIGNIVAASKTLENPHKKFKSIHIAGTNGKGSVSHMLASIFQEAGYKVGLYTSPHLKDFRERIKISGKMIAKSEVIQFVSKNKTAFEKIDLSFFEFTVALAFHYFAYQKVDIAIIETGLGGRLDSTNIINPELSIITNIGLDHTNLLGDTIQTIAKEKAGIIKSNTPIIIGRNQEEIKPIFENIANEKKAPLKYATAHNFIADLKGNYQKEKISTIKFDKQNENSIEELIKAIPSDVSVYSYSFDGLPIHVRIQEDAEVGVPNVAEQIVAPEISEITPEKVMEKPIKKSISKKGSFDYIVGSFSVAENAKAVIATLKSKGMNARQIEEKGLFKVSAGTASSAAEMDLIEEKSKSNGFTGWILKR